MKNTLTTTLLRMLTFVFLGSAALHAQENYTIKISIKTEGLPAEMAAYGEQDMVTYVKGDKSKTEISSMMFSSTTYIDGQKVTSLNDAMGNKSGYTTTKEELEAADKAEPSEKPTITYTEEKKMIAGYECKKAIVTSIGKDKKESVTTVWVTDKIKNPNKSVARSNRRGMADLSDLNGYPLAMEMPMNFQGAEAKVVMNTLEVSTAVIDDAVFTVNTEGYTMMSYKEMKEKQKMMQQGR
jgi:hypothetical protein